ncbi:MAG: hypothetical protein KC468_38730 [Myxococcales bacterium]|nr:hypothetical protein [Myxococcales bacterium]
MSLAIESCAVGPIVDEVLETFAPLAAAARVTLAREGAREESRAGVGALRVMADPARVRQVVGSLVSNAIKFAPGGRVTVRLRAEGDWIEIAVRDTGIGIPADKLDAVFSAFDQVDTSTTRRHDGAGLGLTISRHLIELMGGRVEVSSREGEGSTFTVYLPRDAAAAAA